MGNAYTFELETMIFMALASACTELSGSDKRFVSVYGDDIVVPSPAWDLLRRTLSRCGFVPNEKKTFVSGPFRESCGKHYYNGADVSPFYIRRQPRKLTDLFLLVNNIRRWVWRVSPLLSRKQIDAVEALVRVMRSYAPSPWRRPRIPDNFGDGAFIGTFDECLPSRPHGKWLWWEGWQVEVITDVAKPITKMDSDDAGEALSLDGVMLAMVERLELGDLLTFDDWLQRFIDGIVDDLPDASGGVVPNRDQRWQLTTSIVTQW
jgi:hypothetical protein